MADTHRPLEACRIPVQKHLLNSWYNSSVLPRPPENEEKKLKSYNVDFKLPVCCSDASFTSVSYVKVLVMMKPVWLMNLSTQN